LVTTKLPAFFAEEQLSSQPLARAAVALNEFKNSLQTLDTWGEFHLGLSLDLSFWYSNFAKNVLYLCARIELTLEPDSMRRWPTN